MTFAVIIVGFVAFTAYLLILQTRAYVRADRHDD